MGILNQNHSASLGKYKLIAELGHGGMADVYLAVAKGLADFSKLLVIKLLRNVEDPEFLTMFFDEARLAARLSHPNVVQTYEVGQDGERYFITMEFLHGPTLSSLRKTAFASRGLTTEMSVHIVTNVLSGLQYAHELKDYSGKPLKVVHRDLTPHNIIITFDGECKILDFGIAKASDSSSETRAGVFKGKVGYSSPEQVRGTEIDSRSDIFSAGIILWEAIALRPIWRGVTSSQIWQNLMEGKIPSLESVKPDAPKELIEICRQALAPDPKDRFQSAREFQDALEIYSRRAGHRIERKEISALVNSLFGADRARMQAVIDSQLHATESGGTHIALPMIGVSSSMSDSNPFSGNALSLPRNRSTKGLSSLWVGKREDTEDSLSIAEQGFPKRKRRLMPLAVGSAALFLAAIGIGLWSTRTNSASSDTAPPSKPLVVTAAPLAPASSPTPTTEAATPNVERATEAAAEQPPVPAPAKPPEVRIQIVVSPSYARMVLDSKPLPTNPFQGSFARDSIEHELRIVAQGHLTEVRRISFEQDQTIQVALEKALEPFKKPIKAIKPTAKTTALENAPKDIKSPTKPEEAPEAPQIRPRERPSRSIDTENPWKQ